MSGDLALLLACPTCGGQLAAAPDGLRCQADGARYPLTAKGMIDLRPELTRPEADEFASNYRLARLADGWAPLRPEDAERLPDASPAGFTRLYWTTRSESWNALRALLAGLGDRPLTVADLGAGFPWLSNRLATLGHRVVAVDLSADDDFGLGAARHYPRTWQQLDGYSTTNLRPGRFVASLGDLQSVPLAPVAYDALICNASLHYLERLPAAIARMAAALRPGGVLYVLDSPIALAGRRGRTPGGRVLCPAEVEAALFASGLRRRWVEVERGWLWTRHQAKNWLLRRPSFEFPLIAATKE